MHPFLKAKNLHIKAHRCIHIYLLDRTVVMLPSTPTLAERTASKSCSIRVLMQFAIYDQGKSWSPVSYSEHSQADNFASALRPQGFPCLIIPGRASYRSYWMPVYNQKCVVSCRLSDSVGTQQGLPSTGFYSSNIACYCAHIDHWRHPASNGMVTAWDLASRLVARRRITYNFDKYTDRIALRPRFIFLVFWASRKSKGGLCGDYDQNIRVEASSVCCVL